MITAATQTKADVVIIAGDLFDSERIKDDLISFVVEALKRLPMYVVILPGNHDCLTPASAYGGSSIWEDCPNIRIFRKPEGETVKLPELGITLWGKPQTSYEEEIAPLDGIPRPAGDGCWNIAVAHGLYIGDEEPYAPGGQITHREIVASGWDYIALGHVPVFKVLCREPAVACYSGPPSTDSGCLIVDLSEEGGIILSRYSGKTGLMQISTQKP